MNCKVPIILAYAMSVYTLASLYYIIISRNVGTPFNDSLNEDQRKIKQESANVRRKIFYTGIVLSISLMVLVRPFSKCFEQ